MSPSCGELVGPKQVGDTEVDGDEEVVEFVEELDRLPSGW